MGPRLIDGYHPDDGGQQGDGHSDLLGGETGQKTAATSNLTCAAKPPHPPNRSALRLFPRLKHYLLSL